MAEPSREQTVVLGVAHEPPDFDVPARSCDCHTHVFYDAERFAFDRDRLYTPGEATVDDLLSHQRAIGAERVVLVQPSPYGSDNACMLDALGRLGPCARGVAVIDAATSEDTLRALDRAGVRGARINLATHGAVDISDAIRTFSQVAERIAPFGWHVQTYATPAVLGPMRAALLALPVTLVIDHFGRVSPGSGSEELESVTELLRRGKAYVKLSAPHRISREPDYADVAAIARAMIEADRERVLWGSDWPHTGVPAGQTRHKDRIEAFRAEDDGSALSLARTWTRSDAELEALLVANPARLYGFEET